MTLDITYLQCTNFFSRSRDMIGSQKFKMGHVTITTPPLGWFDVRRLELAMISLCAKFEISVSSCASITKTGNATQK